MPGFDLETIATFLIATGEPVLRAIIYLIVGFQLARLARTWLARALARRSVGWNGTQFLTRTVSVSIKAASVLFALLALGVSPTGLLAVVGAFTVAIGLSLQDVFKNIIAGTYLLIERPFRTGDRIAIRNEVGEVLGIDIRTTLVRNDAKELVLIPNAIVFAEVLRNDTHFGIRRLDFTVTSGDKTATEIDQRIRHALEDIGEVRHPIPVPRIQSSTATEIRISCSIIIENSDQAEMVVAEAIIAALPEDSVEVQAQ